MNPALEIILFTRNPGASLADTVASIAAQSDNDFTVLLCDNHSTSGRAELDATQKKLVAYGIFVKRVQPPAELSPIEQWNWAHAQSAGAWLKPLFSGERLKPLYVERLKQRIADKPDAQLIRCDLELQTEWGPEKRFAPFQASSISRGEFTNYFPEHLSWISHSANISYSRMAWQAIGGYSKHVPASAALNLNVMLALHYGVENLLETLVDADCPRGSSAKNQCSPRSSHVIELWLILLQARNYCLASNLPWNERFPLLRSLMASLKGW